MIYRGHIKFSSIIPVPDSDIFRTPKRVANESKPNLRSPSTSGRSLVMAVAVAIAVTNIVMNLRVVNISFFIVNRWLPEYNAMRYGHT